MSTDQLDQIDRKLLALVQRGVPLVRFPFREIAGSLGLERQDVIRRLKRLAEQVGVIRQISGIFDSRSLGYRSCLVAARCRQERIDSAAAIVNEHPGVSHNYQRSGPFNLWYTLAVPPATRLGLEATIRLLADLTESEQTRFLPALKVYKIGVRLDTTDSYPPNRREGLVKPSASVELAGDGVELDPPQIPLVRVLQTDLPIEADPFAPLAKQVDLGVGEFLEAASGLLDSGHMRRFAAVLRHERAGFTTNVLTAWQVPDDQADRVGEILASFAAVSHCYERPTYPDWPYNVLAMVHARSPDECAAVVGAMVQATGLPEPSLLETVREYKKSRVKYFTGQIEEWEARHT